MLKDYKFDQVPIHIFSIEMESDSVSKAVSDVLEKHGYKEAPRAGLDYVFVRQCGPWPTQLDPSNEACKKWGQYVAKK